MLRHYKTLALKKIIIEIIFTYSASVYKIPFY